MKIRILLTTLLVYTHCHGASKSLSLPAELNKIALQAAADAKVKHEIAVKSAAAHQAAGAGAGQVAQDKHEADVKTDHQPACKALVKRKRRHKKRGAQTHVASEIIAQAAQVDIKRPVLNRVPHKVIDFYGGKEMSIKILKDGSIVKLKADSEFYEIKELRYGNLLSKHEDGFMRIWDLARHKGKELVAVFKGRTTYSNSVLQLEDGRIAWWSEGIRIVDIHNNRPMLILGLHKGHVYSLIELDSCKLISADSTGEIIMWDISKPEVQNETLISGFKNIYGYQYSSCLIKLSDGKIAFSHDRKVTLLDRKFKLIKRIEIPYNPFGVPIRELKESPEGKILIAYERLSMWDWKNDSIEHNVSSDMELDSCCIS